MGVKTEKTAILVRLPNKAYKLISIIARKEGISMAAWVRRAVYRELVRSGEVSEEEISQWQMGWETRVRTKKSASSGRPGEEARGGRKEAIPDEEDTQK